jgi:hypothetical protein
MLVSCCIVPQHCRPGTARTVTGNGNLKLLLGFPDDLNVLAIIPFG